MRKRHQAALALLPRIELRLAPALRERLREGYSRSDLAADAMAGLVVGVVALPLAMALAIASGVPPQHGLYTAIVAGASIAVLGGSRTQVSGPTAAFVVVLAPISARFGLGGLLIATLMAGAMLLAMGLARLGRLIQFIPHPVTTGFTAGIAVVIATLQLKDFLGLTLAGAPEHYVDRLRALWHAAPTLHLPDLAMGAGTLALLLLWPRVSRKVPGPLVGLALAGVATFLLHQWFPELRIATIGERFSYEVGGVTRPGIPPLPPLPLLPWRLPGPDGLPLLVNLELLRALLPSAFAIAVLGAIESLLCAVVADGMTGTTHDPDAELIAQGVGNLAAPFFGGIPATGAIARTATNIRAGGRSPLAALFHAGVVLLGVVVLAPLLAHLPMAALAALMLLVAWNMSEVRHFGHILTVAPRSDVLVLLVCFGLTVIFDMVIAVTAGVMLAAILFMRRMAELSGGQALPGGVQGPGGQVPPGAVLYEIAGPLFFGAAQKAVSALARVARERPRLLVLSLERVPAMDVTGLVALESAVTRLRKQGTAVVLAGVQDQPFRVLGKSELAQRMVLHRTVTGGLAAARELLEQGSAPQGPPGSA